MPQNQRRNPDELPSESDLVVGVFRRKTLESDPTLPPISTYEYDVAVGTHSAMKKAVTGKRLDCVRMFPAHYLPYQTSTQAIRKYYYSLIDYKPPKELEQLSLEQLRDCYNKRPVDGAAKKVESEVVPLKSFLYTVFNHEGKVIACPRYVPLSSAPKSKYKGTDTTLEGICANHLALEGITHFCTETAAKNYLASRMHADAVAGDLHNLLFKRSKPDSIRDAHLKGHKLGVQKPILTADWLAGLGNDFRSSRTYERK